MATHQIWQITYTGNFDDETITAVMHVPAADLPSAVAEARKRATEAGVSGVMMSATHRQGTRILNVKEEQK